MPTPPTVYDETAKGPGLAGLLEIVRRRGALAVLPFLFVLTAAVSLAVFLPSLWTSRAVVLVNRQSASASEIVTGALQDRHRATVVGTRTFGKGVFQEIEQLSNGGALDITVGQYFLPSGRNIGGAGVSEGTGIAPDVKAVDNPKTKPDEALRIAVRTVAHKVA